jgi:hypothetical protein
MSDDLIINISFAESQKEIVPNIDGSIPKK